MNHLDSNEKTELSKSSAINFIGLCQQNDEVIVNEGINTSLTKLEKQCHYHDLAFPSGTLEAGVHVLNAYHQSFKSNAGLFTLTWSLGSHLKFFLDFWPHLILEGGKGSGKTTLLNNLESTIALKTLRGKSLDSHSNLLRSVSNTHHPSAWEEISATNENRVYSAVTLLKEGYNSCRTLRGVKSTEFIISAPILLCDEAAENIIKDMSFRVVTVDITDRKFKLLPMDLPKFPCRQWLEFLSRKKAEEVSELFDKFLTDCIDKCNLATKTLDPRIFRNFAALLTAWHLLCDFLRIDKTSFGFEEDLIVTMNGFINKNHSQ